jgi:nicotinic acid mononucleotide adenylyltransferase
VRPASAQDDILAGTAIFLVEARTRDVSSTTIRLRIAAGHSVGDCVPAAVARHIEAHHLYRTDGRLHADNNTSS